MFHTQANCIIETTNLTQYRLSSGPIKYIADAGGKLTYLYRECYEPRTLLEFVRNAGAFLRDVLMERTRPAVREDAVYCAAVGL